MRDFDLAVVDTSKGHLSKIDLEPGALFGPEIVKDSETIASYVEELKNIKIWAPPLHMEKKQL